MNFKNQIVSGLDVGLVGVLANKEVGEIENDAETREVADMMVVTCDSLHVIPSF